MPCSTMLVPSYLCWGFLLPHTALIEFCGGPVQARLPHWHEHLCILPISSFPGQAGWPSGVWAAALCWFHFCSGRDSPVSAHSSVLEWESLAHLWAHWINSGWGGPVCFCHGALLSFLELVPGAGKVSGDKLLQPWGSDR